MAFSIFGGGVEGMEFNEAVDILGKRKILNLEIYFPNRPDDEALRDVYFASFRNQEIFKATNGLDIILIHGSMARKYQKGVIIFVNAIIFENEIDEFR